MVYQLTFAVTELGEVGMARPQATAGKRMTDGSRVRPRDAHDTDAAPAGGRGNGGDGVDGVYALRFLVSSCST